MFTKINNKIIAIIIAALFVCGSMLTVTEPVFASSWTDNANEWAVSIANDNTYHYVNWTKDPKTKECAICHKHPKGKTRGWNCIGFAWAVWRHGGQLKNKCNCHVISDPAANDMYKASTAKALSIAKQRTGLNNIKVIKDKNGIPKSKWKAGDICLKFKNGKYSHTFYYMGNGKICDSKGSDGQTKNNDQIAVRNYKGYTAAIIIRYTGN